MEDKKLTEGNFVRMSTFEDIYFNDVLFDEFSDITNGIAHKIYDKIINDDEDFNFDDAETLWLKEEYSR